MLIVSLKVLPKKKQHKYAHSLLRECLKPYDIDYTIESITEKNKHGKPYLTEYPYIHYNITHSNGITACISADNECGIDAERVRDYRPNVVKRAFSESEKALIENAPDEEKNLLFFRLWTLKESYVKAIGIGISYPLNTISFSFEKDKIITDIEGYSFKQYILQNGKFVVSVCIKD